MHPFFCLYEIIIRLIVMSMVIMFLTGCNGLKSHNNNDRNGETPDTLRAVTLYGPTSYFNYRGQIMGFDYENLQKFAADEGYVLDLKIAPSLSSLLKMISSEKVDLAAYPVPKIEEYSSLLTYCGQREVTWQVLVQPAGENSIKDVTDLVGKTIYVEKDSKYDFRLRNLNNELGGGINIVAVDKDSIMADDLIAMVDSKEIPMTVVDSDIAELNKSYFPKLDIGLKLSLEQYSSWAVRNDCDSLAAKLNRWRQRRDVSEMMRTVYKKYFELSKSNPVVEDMATQYGLDLKKGQQISPFDSYFKKYADIPGYDWQLLAAIAFNESRFENEVVSWAGAKGVMQLMPATAAALGIENIENIDSNIKGAALLLEKLDSSLAEKVPDEEERIKFVVAAYNCGLGHIYDAIALADKYGLDPEVWMGNVGEAALLKSKPQYYNDPVVKNGYFRARETIDFVEKVMEIYAYFKKIKP